MSLDKKDITLIRGAIKAEVGDAINNQVKPLVKDEIQALELKMDKRFSQVMEMIDGIATQFNRLSDEVISHQSAHDRFERRISKLEKV